MQTYYVITDHLGTPQVLTDENQEVVWQSDATPFGEEQNPSTQQSLRFPGQYADPESGYSYNYFRDYDPRLGRYVQSDPIGLGGGINTYGYVGANPQLYIDPYGESATAVVAGWVAGDFAVPDPTDAAWPKWVGYGLLIGGAAAFDRCFNESSEGADEGDRVENPGKADSPVWNDLQNAGKGRKTNGEKGKRREYYEWDHTHNGIEVYDGREKHKGSKNPVSGEMYKPPVPGRKIDI